jgi:hypothetical protein
MVDGVDNVVESAPVITADNMTLPPPRSRSSAPPCLRRRQLGVELIDVAVLSSFEDHVAALVFGGASVFHLTRDAPTTPYSRSRAPMRKEMIVARSQLAPFWDQPKCKT